MILSGLYTKILLQWAVVIGIVFMLAFHLLGDLQAALYQSYAVAIKLCLLFTIRHNKFSLDYYNYWKARKDLQIIPQRRR